MVFNINHFKQQGLTYGGARPALFNVSLTVPTGIGIDNTTLQKFSFVCRASESKVHYQEGANNQRY